MIEIIPAIDIIGGKCVRLTKGDYDKQRTYADNPAEMAAELESLGARRLHVVDLDGAKSRHIVNTVTLERITGRTNLVVDFGGGIKSEDDIERAFRSGASMVTVGSVAVTDKALMQQWIDNYGAERIILGADVRDGRISVNGWKEDSQEEIADFLEYYINKGVTKVLCTDISRDGTLEGPSLELYRKILQRFPDLYLIASGGVSGVGDIRELDSAGVPAVVFGKAFYEGRISKKELRNLFNQTKTF
ncbi:1-(5-phosphoribosyl)-5-[(5-phosphoribosylamino)methylideneamino]imidazole-4-carboxamide isomerase [Prevotella sp.]|uniref:1-(5-phosphoribosyl)-5-[(5- phosphoribosylamino)methylideneamino]imidazole-4- carboxamide isomerase n=1 Tax=Prevotella sp. TaxID=59823 RepID=UPI003FD7427F